LFELTANSAAEYLEARGMAPPQAVMELGGGVSNTVLMVRMTETRFILKQSLPKLRVEQDWFSDPGRIFREAAALRMLAPHLPAGSLPEVLFEDRANCAFAMAAAPLEAETWKARLMRGDIQPDIAGRIGQMLATIVRVTWSGREWEAQFGDQSVFDELRLDPYYRSTARMHPDLAPHFDRLMRASAARRVSLVHGDWSPKNFLVSRDTVMAIDFEVIHFGDPSFDAAFLLNHLALKSFLHRQYKPEYRAAAERFFESFRHGLPDHSGWMEEATLAHLGALMLARIDGKSPVEYLDRDLRAQVREVARGLIERPASNLPEAFDRI
jgi:5-methylthioribose kinase